MDESKFGSPQRLRCEADAELGENLHDLYTGNLISARKAQNLLVNSSRAGLKFQHAFRCAAKCTTTGHDKNKAVKKTAWKSLQKTNAARSLLRWMKKKSQWPKFYWCKVPLWDRKKKKTSQQWLPFLLPHEWLSDYLILKENFFEGLPDAGTFMHRQLARACEAWESSPWSMFPLGLHGDGVPIQGRMNQDTCDFLSINMPCSEMHCKMRVPFTCIEKRFNAGDATVEAIWSVLTWSLKILGEGLHPVRRHNGKRWLSSEKERAARGGKRLPAKACVIQIRADWDWFQHWMGAPQWNQLSGMCWLCKCKPDQWREMTQLERASQSLSKAEWIEFVQAREKLLCPLFSLPNISNHIMNPDWMHVMDEGFAPLVCGQVLWDLLPCYVGRSADQRVAKLWQEIQSLYKAKQIPGAERLQKLTTKDIKKPKKVPELACKAAECRHFAPLLQHLTRANKYDQGTLHQKAVHALAKHMETIYDSLEKGNLEKLAKAGYKALDQYAALEQEALMLEPEMAILWHSKPKQHLFGHICDLCLQGWNPKDAWNYRDETFAGAVQKLYVRRGGHDRPNAENVLVRWSARQPWPGQANDKPNV